MKIAQAEQAVADFAESAGPRKDWTFEDKTEDSRLKSIVLGLRGSRTDLVAEYNARSKMVNRAIFRNGVPAQIAP